MLQQWALSFTAIFVALDIVGLLPMFLAMTTGQNTLKRRSTARRSITVALVVALIFVFLGEKIFSFLGIGVADFRIAGGLILLLVSLAEILGGPHATKQEATGSTGIVPLAVPLITGPGVLTTLIVQVSSAGILVTVGMLLINYFIAWIALRHCESITRFIGNDGTVVFSKIASLFLAAIAVAMMRAGFIEIIQTHFPHP